MTPREAELERDNAVLRGTVAELRAAVADLRSQLDRQQAHLDRLVKMTFGRSAERALGPTLFDGVEPPPPDGTPSSPASDPDPATEAESPVASRSRRNGRRRPPPDLPVERVVVDLPDADKACPCCGVSRVRVGLGEPSRRYDYVPASVFVRETVRVSYACRFCEQAGHDPQFARPDLPPEPIPQGSAAAGLVAHVLVSKYVDHLPLHRQEAILYRLGLVVSRSTLCDWVLRAADVLAPVYRALVDRIKQSYAVHADDTPVTLLQPRRQAYAWVVVGDRDHPFTAFDLTTSRSQQCPARFLAGYAGFVHADAYAGYNPVHAGVRHVGCWMHARRGFADARDRDPRAADALAHIRTLYAVEARATDLGLRDTDLSEYRRDHSRPILDRFADWLADQARTALPAGAFGQAVGYARNQWASLVR